LGDVSGKGLPASLLMANLQATLRGQALLTPIPKECLARANRLLFNSTSPEKFATLFYAVLDLERQGLCYSNAGHERPILVKANGEALRLCTGGLPLGMVDEWVYEDECVDFHSGDLLVVFSDGIGEAVDEQGEHFGDERALEVVKANAHLSAGGLIERILDAVRTYSGNSLQSDDRTLVVVKRM
jgi:sigma-B regulation protein RsbU (phosphoserine phosphatase)